jgi:hypothetical protein
MDRLPVIQKEDSEEISREMEQYNDIVLLVEEFGEFEPNDEAEILPLDLSFECDADEPCSKAASFTQPKGTGSKDDIFYMKSYSIVAKLSKTTNQSRIADYLTNPEVEVVKLNPESALPSTENNKIKFDVIPENFEFVKSLAGLDYSEQSRSHRLQKLSAPLRSAPPVSHSFVLPTTNR